MDIRAAVIDTNVLYAGLYSAAGASHQILRRVEAGWVVPILSTTLLFEYEDILKRNQAKLGLSKLQIEDVLDSICFHGEARQIHYRWRPTLPDPKDDHVLELAVAAGGADIVTHNMKDFHAAKSFGIRVLSPANYIGEFI